MPECSNGLATFSFPFLIQLSDLQVDSYPYCGTRGGELVGNPLGFFDQMRHIKNSLLPVDSPQLALQVERKKRSTLSKRQNLAKLARHNAGAMAISNGETGLINYHLIEILSS